jgi:histidinol dehydrogenase
MSVLRIALTAAGVAATVARHPAVRAGVKAAPLLITPKMRADMSEAVLATAYKAGAAARLLVGGGKKLR